MDFEMFEPQEVEPQEVGAFFAASPHSPKAKRARAKPKSAHSPPPLAPVPKPAPAPLSLAADDESPPESMFA